MECGKNTKLYVCTCTYLRTYVQMVFSNYIDTYVHNLQLGPEMYFKHILFITACHIHQHVHRPVRMYIRILQKRYASMQTHRYITRHIRIERKHTAHTHRSYPLHTHFHFIPSDCTFLSFSLALVSRKRGMFEKKNAAMPCVCERIGEVRKTQKTNFVNYIGH